MSRMRIIKIIGLSLLAIAAILYWKTLLHLAAWLLLAYWIVKFLLRLAVFFAPVLVFILAVYILFH